MEDGLAGEALAERMEVVRFAAEYYLGEGHKTVSVPVMSGSGFDFCYENTAGEFVGVAVSEDISDYQVFDRAGAKEMAFVYVDKVGERQCQILSKNVSAI